MVLSNLRENIKEKITSVDEVIAANQPYINQALEGTMGAIIAVVGINAPGSPGMCKGILFFTGLGALTLSLSRMYKEGEPNGKVSERPGGEILGERYENIKYNCSRIKNYFSNGYTQLRNKTYRHNKETEV